MSEQTNKLGIEVESFAAIAGGFCDWAEKLNGGNNKDLVIAQKFLAELHVSVLTLRDIGFGDETEGSISHDEWKTVFDRFQTLPLDLYWDVFDPLEEDTPVLNSLADDLADIYRDIKEGLLLYRNGQIVEAVWQWRMHFSIHWGAHLTGAQRAIHSYLSKEV